MTAGFACFGGRSGVRELRLARGCAWRGNRSAGRGGVVSGIATEPFRTDPDHVWVRPPLDVVLTDRQERSLVDVGLMPLSALPYTEEAVFGSVGSLQLPAKFIGRPAAAATNARLSSQINVML